MVDASTTVFSSAVGWRDNDPFFRVIALTPAKARAEAWRALQDAVREAWQDELFPTRGAAIRAIAWNDARAFALGKLVLPSELGQAVLDLQAGGVYYLSSPNPLISGTGILLGLVGLAAVGGIVYAATRPKAAAAPTPPVVPSVLTPPALPASLGVLQLQANRSYLATISSFADPTADVTAAGFQANPAPGITSAFFALPAPSVAPGNGAAGIWSGTIVWTGTDKAPVPPLAHATWISLV